MKKLFILLFIFLLLPIQVSATPATYYTYSFNAKSNIVRTQDAYLPYRTVLDLNLNEPQDIYIDQKDLLYIADSGNSRVIVYDYKTDMVKRIIENELFNSVNGVFATEDGTIYVADASAESIFKLSPKGELISHFERPTSPAFGTTDFNPSKVSVDRAGNIFVIGEGVYSGIIQLSDNGEFLGYFASNDVAITLKEKLEDLLYTSDEQRLLLARNPITFTNVLVAPNGSVYSTSMFPNTYESYENGTYKLGLQRHNTAGNNILDIDVSLEDQADVFVTNDGLIFVISNQGLITVYSITGEFIFGFGGLNNYDDIAGLFKKGVGIAVGSDGIIWAIDSEKSTLQSFKPTEYAKETYAALNLFNRGKYEEAVVIWNEVLTKNQISVLAHREIARNYLYQEQYEMAMIHSELAGNRYFYSQAYWEVRNKWLQDSLNTIFGILIAFVVLSQLFKRVSYLKALKEKWNDKKKHFLARKHVKNYTAPFRALRHPIDTFDDIRRGYYGSNVSAIFYYVVSLITYVVYLSGKDFIYQFTAIEDIDFNSVILGFMSVTLLFTLCNWLVTSINDGNGTLSLIFKVVSYSMLPYMMAMTLTVALSYVLTFNEVFFLQLIMTIGLGWTGIQLFLGLSQVHEYVIRETFKSILLTLLFMLIIVIIILIIIIMWEQVYLFITAIIKEVIRNVKNAF
jgi:tetratricopeptide (TPR) repeat protein